MTESTKNPAEVLGGEYRKTATIRAKQWFKMGDHPAVFDASRAGEEPMPWVHTLEGGHAVSVGDWIATGVMGEHWPIKPGVFAATYEPVENDLRQASIRGGEGNADRKEVGNV